MRAPIPAVLSLLSLLCPDADAAIQASLTERVSVSTSFAQGNGASGTGPARAVAVSADGRVVAFLSVATNLVGGDTNGVRDAFVRDLDLDLTERVSVSSGGAQVNADVTGLDVSGTGRFVAFSTLASNLITADGNGLEDIYLRDRTNGTTVLVSRTPAGAAGNGTSQGPAISDDGRYVAFWSSASNLVAGDTNGVGDVFVFDRISSAVARVSIDSSGAQADGPSFPPAISSSGRYVAFTTRASNIGASGATPFDDIVVHDRLLGSSELVGPDPFLGIPWNDHPHRPTISGDGRYVAFDTSATNVVSFDTNGVSDVFVWDRLFPAVIPVTSIPGLLSGNGDSGHAMLSADGQSLVFQSSASNLVGGDTNGFQDVFVRGVLSGTLQRVSVSSAGAQASGLSGHGAISGDGARVAFSSSAPNLVSGDTNFAQDAFARLLGAPPPQVYCSSDDNSLGCAPSFGASGAASASTGSGFSIFASELLSNQAAILIYSKTGAQELPFGNQYLCIRPPIRRTPPQGTGGTPGLLNCTGSFLFDFNAWIAGGFDASLTVGTTVWAQVWSRDPGFPPPNGTHLTEGLTFVIGP